MYNDNHFHIAFYSAALLVSLTSVVFTKLQKRVDRTQNRLFLLMNYIVLINATTSLVCSVVELHCLESEAAFNALLIFQFLYFFFHTSLAPTLFFYVYAVTGSFYSKSTAAKVLYTVPLLITELFVITNPFLHYVYYYDSSRSFHRNWAELLIYFAAALYFFVAFINLLFSWNVLTKKRRWALVYFFIIALSGVIIQFVDINIKSELFSEALALLGLMLSVESEEDRLDSTTGFYNRGALWNDVNHLLAKKQMFHVICLKLTNPDIVRRVTGSPNLDLVAGLVADYLRAIIPRYFIYHTDPITMLLLLPQYAFPSERSDALNLAVTIDQRFKSDFTLHGIPIKLTCVMMVANVPRDIQSEEELMYMVDSPLPKEFDKTVLKDDDLNFLIRRSDVEKAIHRGLENHNFEVYYQPTYRADDLRIHGAEALIRLHDNILGNIFPDEFVPIAEQTGYIDEIDDFVLNEVCAFLKSGEPTNLGMDCINVNLSVLQCMQDNFVQKILDVVDSYGISKSLINFEITESISPSDYKLLSEVVSELKDNGFQFSMDDYGTGYSNMHSLFSLPFDIVKIDKSILWGAEDSDLGLIILENCVHMIRQMGRSILVEGVETTAHIQRLKELGVDYLQGYYFSRPVPKKELIRLMSKQ